MIINWFCFMGLIELYTKPVLSFLHRQGDHFEFVGLNSKMFTRQSVSSSE